jgi:hypothetical protein
VIGDPAIRERVLAHLGLADRLAARHGHGYVVS